MTRDLNANAQRGSKEDAIEDNIGDEVDDDFSPPTSAKKPVKNSIKKNPWKRPKKLRVRAPIFLLLVLNIFVGGKVIFDRHGLVNYISEREKYDSNEKVLAFTRAENAVLTTKMQLMDADTVNEDYLIDLARREFGFAKSNEFLILTKTDDE